MKPRKRGRSVGRYESGQHFASLPDEVLRSPAWGSIPHFARSVLVGIAAQFRGANNGDLDFPASKAKAYGVSHKELAAAIPLLDKAGLIAVTRRGRIEGGRGVCSLYALTWRPVEASDKHDAPKAIQQPPTHEWANWNPSEFWRETVRDAKRRASGRKRPSPHDGSGPLPHARNDGEPVQSRRAERSSRPANPHDPESSRDLGVRESVEGLIRQQPHLTDIDVSKVFRWKVDPTMVGRIRAALT